MRTNKTRVLLYTHAYTQNTCASIHACIHTEHVCLYTHMRTNTEHVYFFKGQGSRHTRMRTPKHMCPLKFKVQSCMSGHNYVYQFLQELSSKNGEEKDQEDNIYTCTCRCVKDFVWVVDHGGYTCTCVPFFVQLAHTMYKNWTETEIWARNLYHSTELVETVKKFSAFGCKFIYKRTWWSTIPEI